MNSSVFTLAGARVVDPATGRDEICNVVIEGGTVAAVGKRSDGFRIDCMNLVVAPGFVDLHVHLREPGGEDAETVRSGTAAAAAGGFTAVCPMANTDPVTDHAGVVEQVLRLAREAGHCDVYPVGAITRGLRGEELAELGAMAAVGVRCFSDDGRPVRSAQVMRRALEYARTWDAVICNHAEEAALTQGEGGRGEGGREAAAGGRGERGEGGREGAAGGGEAFGAQMNEGERSTVLGLAGWPHEAEEVMVARDLILARGLGARLHVPHVSTADTVELIRHAKARGTRVTAEATPHHFSLTDELVDSYDPVYKVNPPLRTKADVEAVRRGLADGTIDAIATDHAPHPPEFKEQEWGHAPPGMLGLETALAVTLTELVHPEGEGGRGAAAGGRGEHGEGGRGAAAGGRGKQGEGYLTMLQAMAALSMNPARSRDIPGHGSPIEPGAPANLTVFDPEQRWVVDPLRGHSRSRNTPFAGREVRGKVVHTILRGQFTYRDGRLTDRGDQTGEED